MIVSSLAGTALLIFVSTAPVDHGLMPEANGSIQQKSAAVQPLIRSATECIAGKVAADPRFDKISQSADLGDLIVASVSHCVGQVRAMIDAYDRNFGNGTGEAFFMGPYLDILPTAVTKSVIKRAP